MHCLCINVLNFILGIFFYSVLREDKEKKLFEAGLNLRRDLQEEANSSVVQNMMVETNLKHVHDLHGRRRYSMMLDYYQETSHAKSTDYNLHFLEIPRFREI